MFRFRTDEDLEVIFFFFFSEEISFSCGDGTIKRDKRRVVSLFPDWWETKSRRYAVFRIKIFFTILILFLITTARVGVRAVQVDLLDVFEKNN